MDVTFGLLYAMIGVFLAVFLGGLGSSMGIFYAGTAANGVLSEKPEKFGTMLLLVALPGTHGIFGFLIGFLILLKIKFLSGVPAEITNIQGFEILIASLPVAINALLCGIFQGKVCTAGIAVAAKKSEASMKALVYAAMIETYSVLGLVISYFLLNGVKL